MKLSKLIFLFLLSITFFTFITINYNNLNQSHINPSTIENDFYTKLNYALGLSKLQTSSFILKDFQDEIEFFIKESPNQEPIKVKLSTRKDPYLQITSLQEILKVAKIKGEDVKLIDLYIDHPYVTF